jgi:TolB-like protein/lipoprotein NlpI
MSPEQLLGRPVDTRSDIFSLGIVLYEMLTGVHPFAKTEALSTVSSILNRESPSLSEHIAEVPEGLEHVVKKMLAKEPAQRVPSPGELLSQINQLSAGLWRMSLPHKRKFRKFDIRRGFLIAGVLFILLLASAGWFFQPFLTRLEAKPRRYEKSMAVLFLEDSAVDAKAQTLGLVLTDEIIARLSSIGPLRVISREDVSVYQREEKSSQKTAQVPGVDAILRGTIGAADDSLNLKIQLVDTDNNYVLWSETYLCKPNEIFNAHDHIIEQSVKFLNLQLSNSEKRRVFRPPTRNLPAYQNFLQGMSQLTQWTEASLDQAAIQFQKAIELDPGFANSYAYLGFSHLIRSYFRYEVSNKILEQIKENSEKALRLDRNNEIAMINEVGYYLLPAGDNGKLSLRRWRNALLKIKKLIKANPQSALGSLGIAHYYFYRNKLPKAEELLSRVLARIDERLVSENNNRFLRGLAAQTCALLSKVAYQRGYLDGAIGLLNRSLEYLPAVSRTYFQMAIYYEQAGRFEQSIEARANALKYATDDRECGHLNLYQGVNYYRLGDYENAAECFARSYPLLSSTSDWDARYAFIYLFITLNRIGKGPEADELLKTRLDQLADSVWPMPVLAFFAGLSSEGELVAAARKPWQKCEVYYYLGILSLLKSDQDKAKAFFKKCLETGELTYVEYSFAERDLAKLPQ